MRSLVRSKRLVTGALLVVAAVCALWSCPTPEWASLQRRFFAIERAVASAQLERQTALLAQDARAQKLRTELDARDRELATTRAAEWAPLRRELDANRVEDDRLAAERDRLSAARDRLRAQLDDARQRGSHYGEWDLSRRLERLEGELAPVRAAASAAHAKRMQLEQRADPFLQTPLRKELEERESALTAVRSWFEVTGRRPVAPREQRIAALDRTDRCESCHVAARFGSFERLAPADRALASHPAWRTLLALHPVDRFGCTSCHDGDGETLDPARAHAVAGEPLGRSVLASGEMTQASCERCHAGRVSLAAVLSCRTDAECPGDLRCRVPTWPPKDPTTPRAPEAAPACVDRTGAALPRELAPERARGLRVIEEAGCYGCHRIPGTEAMPPPGPDLTRVAAKLNAGWMVEWIRDPAAIHAHARMPSFWPPAVAGSTPEAVAATAKARDAEPRLIAGYLVAQSGKAVLQPAPPGDPARGGDLVETYGCLGCHALAAPRTPEARRLKVPPRDRATRLDPAPDLSDVGDRTTASWLFTWLLDPARLAPEAHMPSFRLDQQEAADLAAFLAEQKTGRTFTAALDVTDPNPAAALEGKRLFIEYGCAGCHAVRGLEPQRPVGPDLAEYGARPASNLPFGAFLADPARRGWAAFTYHKLRNPRAFAGGSGRAARMPDHRLAEDELRAAMVALRGFRGRTLEGDRLGKPAELAAARSRGEQTLRAYNCAGCHALAGQGAAVGAVVERGAERPPSLVHEGKRVQPRWLYEFLRAPTPVRPWLRMRMPTFSLDDSTRADLTAAFAAEDGAPWPFHDEKPRAQMEPAVERLASALFWAFDCGSCHAREGKVAVDPRKAAPDYTRAPDRLRRDYIVELARNPDAMVHDIVMASPWAGGRDPLGEALARPEGPARFQGVDLGRLKSAGPVAQLALVAEWMMRGGYTAAP